MNTIQVLFPWPFAGYSNEGGTVDIDSSVWWDEIVVTLRVDLAGKSIEITPSRPLVS